MDNWTKSWLTEHKAAEEDVYAQVPHLGTVREHPVEAAGVNAMCQGFCAPPTLSHEGPHRDVLEGKGPQRWPQRRLHRRLEEVAKAVGDGFCQLQMPLKLAPTVKET